MRRHAKASSAGSTEGNGNSRGLLGRALATRGASCDSEGSGARSFGHRQALSVAAFALVASLAFGVGTAAATPPTAMIDPNPTASYATAQVSGIITTGDKPTNYRFEYSADPDTEGWQGGQSPTEFPANSGAHNVSEQLDGLKASTEYQIRLVAVNPYEAPFQFYSPEPNPTFTTLPVAKPTVLATADAANVSYTSVEASGSVERPANPDPAFDAQCRFEYVTAAQFDASGFAEASRATCHVSPDDSTQPISTPGPNSVSAELSGLSPSTTYHLRLAAENAGGTDTQEAEHTFTTLAVGPPAVSIDPITDFTGFSADVSGTVNPQAPISDPVFDANWHFECTPDCNTHGGGTILADASPHPVARTVTGLEPDTTYEITLVASNAGGPVTAGPVTVTTPKVAPGVQTLFAGVVQAKSATLAAKVNPLNSPATYQFEWGTGSGYGNVVPAAPVSLGASDNSLHFVTTPLGGLQEATTYHFRISATDTDTGETAHGVDHTFTTLAVAGPPAPCANEQRRVETNSQALPDCRGYEMVMPAVKDFPFGQVNREIAIAAGSGDAVAYITFGAMPGSESGTLENWNVARRGDSDWATTPISPRQDPKPGKGQNSVFQGFSQDLSIAFLTAEDPALTPDAPPGVTNLYLRNTVTGAYTLLSNLAGGGRESYNVGLGGASKDFTHVVLAASEPLLPGAPVEGQSGLYEWVDGQLKYVGIYPDGTFAKFSAIGSGAGGRVTHTVSDDGRRIVFTDGRQLYDRIDGTTTLAVSASQRTDPDPNASSYPTCWGATADGGTVYFTSSSALTDDATTGVDGDGRPTDAGKDLYAYDVDSETLTDLSVDTRPADSATGADVQGVVGTSEDGRYVYFVALGDLADGAISGTPNLYVSHDGEVKFVGALDPADSAVWGLVDGSTVGIVSRVTPDGRNIVVQSVASLTGYDNVDPSTGAPTSQVYRYSADADTLSCVSCRPDGMPPAGSSTITPPKFLRNIPHNVSDDGSRVFFDSADAIVPDDTNGKADVYEWSGGTVRLISDGSGPFDSAFQDASADGGDVFFATADRLVGQDTDSHVDLYDARAGGGFPAPPVASPQCEGEACRTGTSAVPAAVAAGTVNFTAPPIQPKPRKPAKPSSARAKALKACKAKPTKAKRKKCESQVKKRFANKKRSANKSGRGK